MSWMKKTVKTGFLVASLGVASQYAVASAGGPWHVYGHVNKGLHWADDGKENYFSVADNDFSSTRVGVTGHTHHKGMELGAKVEVEYEAASSSTISQRPDSLNTYTGGAGAVGSPQLPNAPTGPDGAEGWGANSSILMRIADVWAADCWGKVTAGHGRMASDQITEMSFGGTDVVTSSDVRRLAAGYHFHDKSLGSAHVNDPTVGQVFGMQDGHGRRNRVRYDSPEWKGLTFGTSLGSRNWSDNRGLPKRQYLTDLTARGHYEFREASVKFGAAYLKFSTNTDRTTGAPAGGAGGTTRRQRGFAASVALLHNSSGLNGAVAYTKVRNWDTGKVPEANVYVQVGKKSDFWRYGKTNITLDYFKAKNFTNDVGYSYYDAAGVPQNDRRILAFTANHSHSRAFGVSAVQELDRWNSEVYASYRNYELNVPKLTGLPHFNDLWAVMLGMRVKFSV